MAVITRERSIPLGQRKLDQDAVDRRIPVETVHEIEELGFRRCRRKGVLHGVETEFLGLPRLRSDINLARRIVADEHHGQPGYDMGFLLQADGLLRATRSVTRAASARPSRILRPVSGRRPCARH